MNKKGVFKYLDCSTAHILPKDMELLASDNDSIITYPNVYGAWVCVPMMDKETGKALLRSGFSKHFLQVLLKAQSAGCYWVKFSGCEYGTIHKDLENLEAHWCDEY